MEANPTYHSQPKTGVCKSTVRALGGNLARGVGGHKPTCGDLSGPAPSTSCWPTIRQERSLGKVNWTASVITDPQRPIKARAIPIGPGGPFNLFKPGAVKVVPEPPKECRTGCHFNRACHNPRKAHAVLRWELVIRRYLRIRNVVEPVECILAAPGTPSTSSRLSGKIKRGPAHWYTK